MSISQSEKDDLIDRLAEEVAERLRKGERPTLKEYIEQYPDLADDIREVLPAMFELEHVKEDVVVQQASPPRSSPMPTSVGDYLILREIGRGGMGVVYEAQQLSLGRRVALKLLPHQMFRAARHRLRFEREARAAARLHHTNIVPVFGVGEHEGQPYYIMQFIHGLGLDEVIDELRRLKPGESNDTAVGSAEQPRAQEDLSAADMARSMLSGGLSSRTAEPIIAATVQHTPSPPAPNPSPLLTQPDPALTPSTTKLSDIFTVSSSDGSATPKLVSSTSASRRSSYWHCVARIGRQVAEALDYAHKQGIVHRDIKPSNLLLDTREIVWVTDFGLAKVTSSGGDNAGNVTHSGDLLGTLRYMPPEAFDGKSDARSDIYGLGLTLYEMLAFRPAFDERERSRLIKQVTLAEPARLERINPGIPADLATIVHKAIHGDAKDRYASASEMAADLRRFLDDEPILARRISGVERIYRWCYRNPMVAALTTAVAILVAVVGTGTWLATVMRSERDLARASQERAERAERENQIRAHLASATAYRRSGRPGQHVKALEAIQKALDLDPPWELKQELRTEAIAALVLPDLQIAQGWDGFPVGTSWITIDPNFERYARGDNSTGKVGVYRVSDNALLQSLEGAGPVDPLGVEFSPDGRFLHQICDLDNSNRRFRSRLWRLDGSKPVAIVDDEHGHCAFEPHGNRCALAYPDQTVRLLDLDTGKEVKRIRHHLGAIPQVLAWNPRYPVLAVIAEGTCQLLDLDTGMVSGDLPKAEYLDWHPDGRVLALCALDLKIYLLDYRTGRRVLPPLEGHNRAGILCRFNHAGDWLVSNDWWGLTRLWDARTGQELLRQESGWALPQFSRDDAFLGPSTNGTQIQLMRCAPGKGLRTVPGGNRAAPFHALGRPCVDETGRWLAVASVNGSTLVDLWRGSDPVLLPERGNIPLRFDPVEHSLWTHGNNGLLRWPIRSDGPDRDIMHVGPPERLATWATYSTWGASRDGNTVAIARYSEGAILWRRSTNKTVTLGPQNDVRTAAVSSDGRWVATGSHSLKEGGGAQIWDAKTGKQIAELPVLAPCTVRFSPGDKWLVTGGSEYRIWEVGTWREGPSLGGPGYSTPFCAFASSDELLALQDQPSLIRLVIPDTGREVARLTIPGSVRLRPLCFTPDGSQLAVVGNETQDVYLFDLRAIRSELQKLDLDWDAPPLPPVPEKPAKPIRWVVETADFLRTKEADQQTQDAADLTDKKK